MVEAQSKRRRIVFRGLHRVSRSSWAGLGNYWVICGFERVRVWARHCLTPPPTNSLPSELEINLFLFAARAYGDRWVWVTFPLARGCVTASEWGPTVPARDEREQRSLPPSPSSRYY